MHEQEEHPLIPYSLFIKIWMALVTLTLITVGVSYLDLHKFKIFTALLVAITKATLVLLYFMHIRFEKPLFTYLILAVLGTYIIFVVLTFSDYSFR